MPFTPEEEERFRSYRAKELETAKKFSPEEELKFARYRDMEKTAATRAVADRITNFVSEGMGHIIRTGQIYKKEVLEGREQVRLSYAAEDESVWKRAARLGLGTLQYMFSPIKAVAQGMIGEPLTEVGKAAGLPKEAAEFVGKLGEEAVYFIPPGATVRSIMMRGAEPGFKALTEVAAVAPKVPKPKGPSAGPVGQPVSQEALETSAAREAILGTKMPGTSAAFSNVTQFVPKTVPSVIEKGMINVEKTQANLPKVPEGMVRLYRGEHPTAHDSGIFEDLFKVQDKGTGGWFTDDIKYADYFRATQGKGAHIVYMDIPEEIAKKRHISNFPDLAGLQKVPDLTEPAYFFPELRIVPGQARAATSTPANELLQAGVKTSVGNQVATAAEAALQGKLDKKYRIFRQIGERIALGEINVEAIPEILAKHGLSPVEFAKLYEETASASGRFLGYLSRTRQRLEAAFADSPEALKILQAGFEKEAQAGYLMDKFLEGYGRLDNFRRAMLVGQVATGMRNILSQAGRLSVGAIDDALQGAIKGTFGAQGNTLQQVREGLNGVTAALSQVSPAKRNRIMEILEADHAIIEKTRLFSQPVHEVTLGGKISSAVNWLNRAQETFFRRIGFEAKMRSLLERKGLNWNTVNPAEIPEDMFADAVNYAMEMTFAASPKSKAGQQFVRAWTKIPGMTLVNPFPRFNFANAIPFMMEHSPLGYLNAVRPSVLKELASGNPDRFARAASRATLGSLMLDSAMSIRQSKYAGEKWYEIQTGVDTKTGKSKVIDTRAFPPFSIYLLLAEAFIHPERLKPSDFAGVFVGLSRVAGTGLVLTDWLRQRSGEGFEKQIRNFAGQYLASYTVPARTASDLYSGIDPEETIYRDYRESPIMSPIMMNLPKISQTLPEKPSPVKTGRPYKSEEFFGVPGGVARQLTGLSRREKTLIEREIDRVGLEWTAVAPRTGIPQADRILSLYMAPTVERLIPRVMADEDYQKLTDTGKRVALASVFQKAREDARKYLALKDPKLSTQIDIKGVSKDMQRLARERRPEVFKWLGME